MKSFTDHLYEEKFRERVSPFLEFCASHLELSKMPRIEFINDKSIAMENRSFGGYSPGDQSIRVNIAERHAADIFRTLAHELVHYKQDCDGRLDERSGETGSEIENEANAVAGVIMRNYARHESSLFEERDACYDKVKSRYKVWPSAYASGALVKCRKVGAKNWGTKSEDVQEDLRKWFREKWVRFDTKGNVRGECAREHEGEAKPKCLPRAKAHALGKEERARAARRKRRKDPHANRRGPAINVRT